MRDLRVRRQGAGDGATAHAPRRRHDGAPRETDVCRSSARFALAACLPSGRPGRLKRSGEAPTTSDGKLDVAAQILRQATRLFAARGFVGASLHDIAQAVGIRKPSLLYHFHSKEDLRRRVLEQMLAHWSEVIPRILQASASGEAQFDAIAQETIRFFSEDPDRARVLLRELLDRPQEIAPLIEVHVRPWAKILGDYIRRGQAQGRIDPEVDPEAWVASMINLVLSSVAIHAGLGRFLAERKRHKSPSTSVPPRLVQELLRMARSSLFIAPSVAASPDPQENH